MMDRKSKEFNESLEHVQALKTQELETLKLHYDTKIQELTFNLTSERDQSRLREN